MILYKKQWRNLSLISGFKRPPYHQIKRMSYEGRLGSTILESTLSINFQHHRSQPKILNNCSILLIVWTSSLHVCTISYMYISLNLIYTKRFAHLDLKIKSSSGIQCLDFHARGRIASPHHNNHDIYYFLNFKWFLSLLGTLFLNPQHFDKLSFSNGRGQDMWSESIF